MKRAVYWTGVLGGVLLLAGGIVVGALGLTAAASPASVVRSYFAALARGDAAAALGYGTVPAGPRLLLTDAVLREQQRIAPLHDVSVRSTQGRGSSAVVSVRYRLAFPGADVSVSEGVPVHKSFGRWRLDAVAVATTFSTPLARQRESILGGPLPRGATLLFPGALPIRLDTPYLALDPDTSYISFNSLSPADVDLRVTPAGRTALIRMVRERLRRCFTTWHSPACPLPNGRYVPGSLSGRLAGPLRATMIRPRKGDQVGSMRLDARAYVVGSYRRLDFHNRPVTGHGRVAVGVHSVAYAVPPLRVWWISP